MIKTKTCGLSETTRQQGRKPDEICRVHTCICNEGGKNRRANDEKGDE